MNYKEILSQEQYKIFDSIIQDIQINHDEGCFGENIIMITGQAGTGKSFLSAALIKYLEDTKISTRPIKCTALTHKAAAELQKKLKEVNSSLKTGTIHSYLKIKASINYQTGKEEFKVERNAKIVPSSVLFIDECSMIDADLFKIIREHMELYETVIMIGDEYQTPPVNRGDFNLFTHPSIKTHKLENIVRQAAGNPIIQLSNEIVQKIKTKDFNVNFCNDLILKSACEEIVQCSPNEFIVNYINYTKNDVNKPLKGSRFTQALITTFTNDRVNKYNTIAKTIYKNTRNINFIDQGDIVVTQEPAFNQYTKDIELSGNSEFFVQKLTKETFEDIPCLILENDDHPYFFLRVIDEHDFLALQMYNKKLQYYKNNALLASGKQKFKAWQAFYNFKRSFVTIKQIFACTTHKAQGTTVNRIYVDMNNMPWEYDIDLAYRLTYVACTRSTDKLIVTL